MADAWGDEPEPSQGRPDSDLSWDAHAVDGGGSGAAAGSFLSGPVSTFGSSVNWQPSNPYASVDWSAPASSAASATAGLQFRQPDANEDTWRAPADAERLPGAGSNVDGAGDNQAVPTVVLRRDTDAARAGLQSSAPTDHRRMAEESQLRTLEYEAARAAIFSAATASPMQQAMQVPVGGAVGAAAVAVPAMALTQQQQQQQQRAQLLYNPDTGSTETYDPRTGARRGGSSGGGRGGRGRGGGGAAADGNRVQGKGKREKGGRGRSGKGRNGSAGNAAGAGAGGGNSRGRGSVDQEVADLIPLAARVMSTSNASPASSASAATPTSRTELHQQIQLAKAQAHVSAVGTTEKPKPTARILDDLMGGGAAGQAGRGKGRDRGKAERRKRGSGTGRARNSGNNNNSNNNNNNNNSNATNTATNNNNSGSGNSNSPNNSTNSSNISSNSNNANVNSGGRKKSSVGASANQGTGVAAGAAVAVSPSAGNAAGKGVGKVQKRSEVGQSYDPDFDRSLHRYSRRFDAGFGGHATAEVIPDKTYESEFPSL